MPLVTCSECNAEISDKALACPRCGAPRTVKPGTISSPASQAQAAAMPGQPARIAGIVVALVAAILSLFVISAIAATSCGSSADRKNRVTRTDMLVVASAAVLWMVDNQGCPRIAQLEPPASTMTDGWGNALTIRTIGAECAVVSAGPDEMQGTYDDMVESIGSFEEAFGAATATAPRLVTPPGEGEVARPTSAIGESWQSAVPRGQTLVVAGLEVEVLSARVARSVQSGFMDHEAGEGATLLVVTYRVKNVTSEAIQVMSFADAVVNRAGASFEGSSDCAMALPRNTPMLGFTDTLNPGLPKTFGACFEVPVGTTGWVLKVNRMFEDGFLEIGE